MAKSDKTKNVWSWWWSSSSSRNNTSYNFVDPSVLHDAQINGSSREQIDAKWWTWTSNVVDKYDKTYNKGWQTSWQYWASRKSWWSSNWWSSSTQDYISSMQFWQWTADDYQKNRNNILWKYYSDLGKYDYNTIYNDLSKNSWFVSASENDKRATVNRIMEQAANAKWWTLTSNKTDDDIAMETQNPEEDIDTTDYDELFNWVDEDWLDDYFYDRLYSSKEWNDLTNQVSDFNRQLQANEVKETVPEVKDETYNYNTYFNDNLADKTMHEGWESKDIQDSWLTFAQTIQEPTTNALQDLWLLWDNEETANEFPTEQPQQNNYSSWEEVVSAFNNAIQMALNPENWSAPTDKSITKLYSDYKKQLMIMLNNKQITPEQFKDYLWQIRNNERLQTFINNYANNKWQMS